MPTGQTLSPSWAALPAMYSNMVRGGRLHLQGNIMQPDQVSVWQDSVHGCRSNRSSHACSSLHSGAQAACERPMQDGKHVGQLQPRHNQKLAVCA